jgi:hypothetical protein
VFKLFKWMAIYCLVFGGIGFALSGIFSQFPVMDAGAKGYVLALKEKNHIQAYSYMSADFREKVAYQDFIQGLKDANLYYAISWEKKEAHFNEDKTKGVAIGYITTKKGDKIRRVLVEIQFVHVSGTMADSSKNWYVQSISEIEGGMP